MGEVGHHCWVIQHVVAGNLSNVARPHITLRVAAGTTHEKGCPGYEIMA